MVKYKSKLGEESNNKFDSSIKIIGYRGYNDIDIYFPDYDWTYYNTNYNQFKNGTVKCPYEPRIFNVGYIGEGKYKSRENGIKTRVYMLWYDMLRRCYDESHRYDFISYENCYVCDEWLNFQNFAEWYDENYYEIDNETTALDKDILFKGNDIYSPETCVFVPYTINNLILKRQNDRGEFPLGVWYDKKRDNYKSYCCNGQGKTVTLGRYKTVEEAFNKYKEYKENLIKRIADSYIDKIPYIYYMRLYTTIQ